MKEIVSLQRAGEWGEFWQGASLMVCKNGLQTVRIMRTALGQKCMFADGIGYCNLAWNLVKILEKAGIAQW